MKTRNCNWTIARKDLMEVQQNSMALEAGDHRAICLFYYDSGSDIWCCQDIPFFQAGNVQLQCLH